MKPHRKQGEVEWMGIAAKKRAPIEPIERARLEVGSGIDGDHHSARRPGGKRQVTLIQAEHLDAVASILGVDVHPSQLRRNIVVRGINLYALRGARFQVGTAVLEGTGICDPCARMEENLGAGGLGACRGHGGITARVVEAGDVGLGDAVRFLTDLEGFSVESDLH